MGSYSWRDSVLNYDCHSVHTASAKLKLHRLYANCEGTPVFMVHGIGGSADDFIQRQQPDAGLAPLLAAHGFDVYVADLSISRGLESASATALHQLILEEIPAHLGAIAKLRPACPQFWLGHGFGAALLASCYARLDLLPSNLLGMVQINAGRRCELSSLLKSIKYTLRQGVESLAGLLPGSANPLFGAGLDSQLRREVLAWQQQADWKDPKDGFNYRAALQLKGMPSALYLSVASNGVRASVQDTRLWVQELGRHDARIIQVSKRSGNLRNYGYNSLLSRPEACEDHFLQILTWLQEHGSQNINMERHIA